MIAAVVNDALERQRDMSRGRDVPRLQCRTQRRAHAQSADLHHRGVPRGGQGAPLSRGVVQCGGAARVLLQCGGGVRMPAANADVSLFQIVVEQ